MGGQLKIFFWGHDHSPTIKSLIHILLTFILGFYSMPSATLKEYKGLTMYLSCSVAYIMRKTPWPPHWNSSLISRI